MLTITLFNIVHGEVEGAARAATSTSTSLYTASAKAYLGPSFGRFVPYAGIGAGVYHETLPVDDDQGTTGLVFVGVKLKFPIGLVLRGEYQWVDHARRRAAAARQPLLLRRRAVLLERARRRRSLRHAGLSGRPSVARCYTSPPAMVFLNYTAMQMTAKIVYYGPGLCGKTTNLQWIHGKTAPRSRGEMVSLETEADRTLFFDLLPLDVGVIGGMKVRLQLYTVPGQVFYNATRRLVLKGVDGVVFVADSQVPAAEPNEESLVQPAPEPRGARARAEERAARLPVQQAGPAQHPAGRQAAAVPEPRRGALLRGGGRPRRRRLRDAQGDLAALARLDPREDRRAEEVRRRGRRAPASARRRRAAAPPPAPRRAEAAASRGRGARRVRSDGKAAAPTRRCSSRSQVEFAEEDTDKSGCARSRRTARSTSARSSRSCARSPPTPR